jgi:TPR repeat protein
VTSKRPYTQVTLQEFAKHLLSGKRETIPAEVPAVYAEIIQACWQENPTKRPDLLTIIQLLEKYQIRSASPDGEEYYQQGAKYEKEQDYIQAHTCYEKAVGKNYYRAKTNLAMFFLQNKGKAKPEDKPKAYPLLLDAASSGHHVRAMFNLAQMFEYGDGVEKKDLAQALYLNSPLVLPTRISL